MPLLKCRKCGYQAIGWFDYIEHKMLHPTHQ